MVQKNNTNYLNKTENHENICMNFNHIIILTYYVVIKRKLEYRHTERQTDRETDRL